MVDLEKELEKADELFEEALLQECIDVLKTLDQSNVHVLWRLARACFQLSKIVLRSEKVELINAGFQYAKESLESDEPCDQAHMFYACLLDARSELKGLRERAMQLHNVKAHIARALELNPLNPFNSYALGTFIYEMTDLAWYKRKIVEAVWAQPPEGTYEEALEHFLRAEELEPDFYSVNKLMIAKTLIALKDYENARKHLAKAASIKIINDDDKKCAKDARALLLKYN